MSNIIRFIISTPQDWFFIVVTMMALDFSFGFLKAVNTRTVTSWKMKIGLLQKGAILLLVAGFDFSAYRINPEITSYVACFWGIYITLMEIASILENSIEIGLPVPPFFKKLFENSDAQEKTASILERLAIKFVENKLNIDIPIEEEKKENEQGDV